MHDDSEGYFPRSQFPGPSSQLALWRRSQGQGSFSNHSSAHFHRWLQRRGCPAKGRYDCWNLLVCAHPCVLLLSAPNGLATDLQPSEITSKTLVPALQLLFPSSPFPLGRIPAQTPIPSCLLLKVGPSRSWCLQSLHLPVGLSAIWEARPGPKAQARSGCPRSSPVSVSSCLT